MINNTKRNIAGILVAVSLAFLLSACSSGGSGGASSGSGSSIVEGNVVSLGVAMGQPVQETKYSVADFFTMLLPITSAHADAALAGIGVNIAGMRTVTDTNGYFMIAGVPPGTHQIMFDKNGITSTMQVAVGVNDRVTMQNVSIHGRQSRAQSVDHMSTGPGPGTQAGQAHPVDQDHPVEQNNQINQGPQGVQDNHDNQGNQMNPGMS